MRRRPLTLVIVLSVLIALVISAHAYIAARLVQETALPEPWSSWALASICALGLSIFAHPIIERRFGPKAGRFLGWPAYLWMGTAFYLLLGLWVSDFLFLIVGAEGVDVARTRAAVVLVGTLVLVALGCFAALRPPAVKRVDVRIDGWPAALDGYRIVQLTDVHIGALIGRRFAEQLMQRCNALHADIIAITGDLVDGSVRHLDTAVAPLGELRARDGVYFVTGNHDYYSGADGWVAKMQELGIEVLRNRRVAIEHDGARFELAGVDDLSSGRGKSGHDLPAALLDWDETTPLVLLAHHPKTFEQAQLRGVHLQLSGHTHGGQMWPFAALVRLQTRYIAGLYQAGRSLLYVSRGTGYWGPPIRVFSPAEITELVLHPH